MNHKEFCEKYLGTRNDYDRAYWWQCTDVVKLYADKLFWIRWLSFGGSAINWWNRKWNLDTFLDRINVPQQGDIVFFGTTPTNPYWHVAIVDTGLSIVEQNWARWSWTWKNGDEIRIHKTPSNILWYMRNRTIADKDLPIIRQWREADCSLISVINCFRLNNKVDWLKITQDVANKYMKDYINKYPQAGFEFLKEKGHPVKYIPYSFADSKRRLNKWMALVAFLKVTKTWWLELVDDKIQTWRDNNEIIAGKNHYFVLKMEWDKMYIYDSNLPFRYEIQDWERFVREGVIWKTFYQIR